MSILTDLTERLRALLFRRREERELAEELRFHTEMEAEYQRSGGLDDIDARRTSLIKLGGVQLTREEVRDASGVRLFDDATGDVNYALRTLGRSRGFTIVVILTLALGIGGTTAVFSAIDAVLLEPLPYQEPGQLARIYQNDVAHPMDRGFVSPVHFLAYRSDLTTVDGVAAISTYSALGGDIGSGDAARRIRMLPVSANYFDVIKVEPELGHPFLPEDDNGPDIGGRLDAATTVMLSHELWQKDMHGDPSVIGRPLVMSGRAYTIVGVMPPRFRDPIAGAIDVWVPINLTPGKDAKQTDNHYLTLIARLRPGVTIERAQADLDGLSVRLGQQYPNVHDARARLVPLKEDIVGSSSKAMSIVLGAVGLLLLLVCVNIANLMLVRGSERTREFAVRSALGARRGRLARQLLVESLTLAMGGALAGLLVARLVMSAIVALGVGTIPRLSTLALDPRLLVFSLLLATGCAVLFGFAPAMRAAGTQPGDALREQDRSRTSSARSIRVREGLVVTQVAVAFVLLAGASLLFASLLKIRQVDLGVKPDGVLTFELSLPDTRYDSTARRLFYESLAERIEALPGVRAAGGISKLPAAGPFNQWGTVAGTGPFAGDRVRGTVVAQHRIVSGDYFRAVGIPALAGRTFDARDDDHVPQRIVISKSLAERMFPGMDAVGQRLEQWGEIIGVVGDVSLDNEGRPALYVYHPHRQYAGERNWSLMQVIATTGSATTVQSAVRRILVGMDPELVMYQPAMLGDVVGRGAAQRVFTLRLLAGFAVVALSLAALGLFGVLSYGVKLRQREFGIRLALGAERRGIGAMVLRQGLVVTAAGLVFGLIGALALSRVFASMLFHVSPLEWRVLIGVAAFMSIVAALAAYPPAWRATSSDPRTALQ